MQIRKFGHSCLLVEDGDARVLLDPGAFSAGFEELTDLAAVLITHQHRDHVDVERLRPLLAANPGAALYADEATADQLAGHDLTAQVVHAGDELDVAGMAVRAVGGEHAVIHPDIPVVPNVGYLLAGRLLHPGDALVVPAEPVEVLGVPVNAPWSKAAEVVDWLRRVAPALAVPIHDGLLARPEVYLGLLESLKPDGTTLRSLDDTSPVVL